MASMEVQQGLIEAQRNALEIQAAIIETALTTEEVEANPNAGETISAYLVDSEAFVERTLKFLSDLFDEPTENSE